MAKAPLTTDQPTVDLAPASAAIAQGLAASGLPGLVMGVTDRARLLKVIVHGHADWKARTPLTSDSRLAIGSVSKSFTAIALLQLAAEGRIDLHAPLHRYLPSFEIRSEFEPITAHHLIVHTSGLPGYLTHAASSRYVLAALRDFEPSYAPGKHWSYSNTGYQLLGYVLEDLEATSYSAIIRRRVLQPLGMNATASVIDDLHRTDLAVSYARWPYDGKYQEAPWFEYAAGDGSLVSTVPDMCAYARFMLNRGVGPQGRVLAESQFTTFTTPVLGGYSYGLFVKQDKGGTVVGHEGGIGGFHSVLDVHLDEGFGLMILSSAFIEEELKHWIGECVASAFSGAPCPPVPSPSSRQARQSLADDMRRYVGIYRAADEMSTSGVTDTLEFVAANGGLALKQEDNDLQPLRRLGPDCFRLSGESPGLPFFFARGEKESGQRAVEVSRGARWYITDAFSGTFGSKEHSPAPENSGTYVGHFANDGPEGPVARVFVRNGRLWALLAFNERAIPTRLMPIGPGLFRLEGLAPASSDPSRDSDEPKSPERVRFDTVLDGRALRMTLSGVPLYRKDTP